MGVQDSLSVPIKISVVCHGNCYFLVWRVLLSFAVGINVLLLPKID